MPRIANEHAAMATIPDASAVHPVDQVDEVRDGGDPQDRQRVGGPAEVVVADDRQRHVPEGDVVADHRDRGDGDDPGHLHARADPADVVDEADHGRQQRPEQDPAPRPVEIDADERARS